MASGKGDTERFPNEICAWREETCARMASIVIAVLTDRPGDSTWAMPMPSAGRRVGGCGARDGSFFLLSRELSTNAELSVFDEVCWQCRLIKGGESVFDGVFETRIETLNQCGIIPRQFAGKVAKR